MIGNSHHTLNEIVDLTLYRSLRWLIDVSSVKEIKDKETITKLIEENPVAMNLNQRLNSKNQENDGKRNEQKKMKNKKINFNYRGKNGTLPRLERKYCYKDLTLSNKKHKRYELSNNIVWPLHLTFFIHVHFTRNWRWTLFVHTSWHKQMSFLLFCNSVLL